MDANIFEAFKGIENAISTPRCFDWWMFVITTANVIAFVILTIYIAKLNKKVANDQKDIQTKIAKNQKEIQIEIAKNQEDLQKRNLKLQLFEKRYPLYLAVINSYEKSYLDIKNILSANYAPIKDEEFELALKNMLIELKYNNLFATLLYGESFKNLIELESKFNLLIKYLSDVKDYFKSEYCYLLGLLITDYEQSNGKSDFDFDKWADNNTNPFMKKLLAYSNAQKDYCKYIEDNKILEEFQKYLNVNDLEK